MHIWAYEDNKDDKLLLEYYLRGLEPTFEWLDPMQGESILPTNRAKDPDLIIVDGMLTLMHGSIIINQLLRTRYGELPIMLLTSVGPEALDYWNRFIPVRPKKYALMSKPLKQEQLEKFLKENE